MPIETIEFNGQQYPAFQAEGNAAQWVANFAKRVCRPTGTEYGLDIGCNRIDWCLDGAIPIDPLMGQWDAYNLPPFLLHGLGTKPVGYDFLFSSHCCEHLPNWVTALNYWATCLKKSGVLFLYLPDMESQTYWRGWHNKKHTHYLTPRILREYFDDNNHLWTKVFVSGVDANNSFTAFAEKI